MNRHHQAYSHTLLIYVLGMTRDYAAELASLARARLAINAHSYALPTAVTADEIRDLFSHRLRTLHDRLLLSGTQEAAWSEFRAQIISTVIPSLPDFTTLDCAPSAERRARKLGLIKAHLRWAKSRIPVVIAFYATLTKRQQKIFDAEFKQRFVGETAEAQYATRQAAQVP